MRDLLFPQVKCAIKAKVVHNDGTGRIDRQQEPLLRELNLIYSVREISNHVVAYNQRGKKVIYSVDHLPADDHQNAHLFTAVIDNNQQNSFIILKTMAICFFS